MVTSVINFGTLFSVFFSGNTQRGIRMGLIRSGIRSGPCFYSLLFHMNLIVSQLRKNQTSGTTDLTRTNMPDYRKC